MKEAFEKMTGMPDAWTNPALMVSRNAFIQGWEARAQQPAYVQQEYECVVYQCPRCATSMQVDLTAKAALAQEQEPVAFINVEQRKLEWAKYMTWDTPTVVNLPKIPLYTTPPQRTWVGLTDDEIYDAAYAAYCRNENSRELFRIMWNSRLTCSIGWDRDELKSFARNIAAIYIHPREKN